jgi:hypothetical protein
MVSSRRGGSAGASFVASEVNPRISGVTRARFFAVLSTHSTPVATDNEYDVSEKDEMGGLSDALFVVTHRRQEGARWVVVV